MLAKTKTVQPNVINGINVDDVTALIEDVRRDAANGKTHWRVASFWQGQTRSRSVLASNTPGFCSTRIRAASSGSAAATSNPRTVASTNARAASGSRASQSESHASTTWEKSGKP